MAYGTINADVISTSVANTSLGAGNATRFKNRIINGNMVIDQRNAGASVTPNNSYTLDRWLGENSQTSKYTVQQNAAAVTPPVGFINYLGVASSSAFSVAAADYFAIGQRIEGLNVADLGWGTANAKTVTLSFQVYSSLTGTFGGSLANGAANRSYPFTYSIPTANTWTSISVTVAGDTSGTWLTTNGIGLRVWFGLGAGSTYSGTGGAWSGSALFSTTGAVSVVSTSGATFYITGVQLEVGSSATGFDYRDYTSELCMCQRYFQKSYPSGSAVASLTTTGQVRFKNYAASTGDTYSDVRLCVTMRTTPTVTTYNPTTGASGWTSVDNFGETGGLLFKSLTTLDNVIVQYTASSEL